MKMSNKYYKEHYLDASKPGSFSSSEKLAYALKESGQQPRRKELLKWMMGEKAYTLHKRVTKNFNRNKVFSKEIDYLWQIDLVDVKKIAKHNKQHKYLMTVIDVFSKYAWVKPIKDKTGKAVAIALSEVFTDGRIPQKIQTDEGKEFLNKEVKALLDKYTINLYIVNSELKASVVERFNRTLKERIYRYFTSKESENYLTVLNDIVHSYNNTYHRSIKTTPIKVNKTNESKIRNILYGDERFDYVKFKFDKGDYVRLSKEKAVFIKGYERNWTREIFEVIEQIPRDPPVYRVKDFNNEIIEGVFYAEELQKVYLEGGKS